LRVWWYQIIASTLKPCETHEILMRRKIFYAFISYSCYGIFIFSATMCVHRISSLVAHVYIHVLTKQLQRAVYMIHRTSWLINTGWLLLNCWLLNIVLWFHINRWIHFLFASILSTLVSLHFTKKDDRSCLWIYLYLVVTQSTLA